MSDDLKPVRDLSRHKAPVGSSWARYIDEMRLHKIDLESDDTVTYFGRVLDDAERAQRLALCNRHIAWKVSK